MMSRKADERARLLQDDLDAASIHLLHAELTLRGVQKDAEELGDGPHWRMMLSDVRKARKVADAVRNAALMKPWRPTGWQLVE